MCQYFSHDYDARQDIKIRRLQYDLGLWGIGAYWSLVEELYQAGNHLLTSDLPMIAKSLGTTLKRLMRVVSEYSLFAIVEEDENGGYICSESVGRRLDMRKETAQKRVERVEKTDSQREKVSEARRAAVNKRWEKRQAAIQSDTKAIQNGIQTDTKADTKPIQNSTEADTNGDTKPIQTDTKAPYINIKYKNRNINTTTTTTTSTQAQEQGGKQVAKAPQTAEDISAELTELMRDENVCYQLHTKSGGMQPADIAALLPEFASQLQLTGNTEAGAKLAMHFAYWLGKKKLELDKQKRNGDYRDKERQRFADTQRVLDNYMRYGCDRPDGWARGASDVQPASLPDDEGDDWPLPKI